MIKQTVRTLWLIATLLALGLSSAQGEPGSAANAKPTAEAKRLVSLLEQPEDKMDFARIKLTIDKMVDPKIDIEANLKRIDAIVSQIRDMAGQNPTSDDKVKALRRYLYEPGSWNGFEAYHYDFDDPRGIKIANKLLPNYLATKKGQCVSMPVLFIVLGQRLGLNVVASTAPEHVFVKYTDDAGVTFNLEATSGATPQREVWMRQQTPMTDQAIANGVYLRKLSKRETAAVMAEVVAENLAERKEYEKEIAVADVLLHFLPKSVDPLLYKGSAYGHLIREKYQSRYRTPRDIPSEEWPDYQRLAEQSEFWYSKAESLGWRQPGKLQEARYMETVNRAKSAQ